MNNQQKMNRRRFIKMSAAAGVLAAGGAALWKLGAVRLFRDTALQQFPGVLYVERLRQVVAADSGRARVLMWEVSSPAERPTVEVRLQGEENVMRRYPAADDRFTDDGSEVYQYTAELEQLMPGTKYQYRITAG